MGNTASGRDKIAATRGDGRVASSAQAPRNKGASTNNVPNLAKRMTASHGDRTTTGTLQVSPS